MEIFGHINTRIKGFFLILALLGLVHQGCKKDNPVSHSECKDFSQKSTSLVRDYGSDTSCLEYTFIPAEGKLVLKHINAGFNCCPGSLYCDTDVQGTTITLTEREEEALCDCLCLYDLDVVVSGISGKEYLIVVEEPYAQGQEKIEFQADLGQSQSGSWCVERTMYPWGL